MINKIQSGAVAHVHAKSRAAGLTGLIGIAFLVVISLMPFVPNASAQALPAAQASPVSTGFALPSAEGTLQYGASASETLTSGYYSGISGPAASTNLNGDVGYVSGSKSDPFSMIFSGGHSWSNSIQPSYSYLNLALSQVITTRLWTFIASDSVSYLPSTPVAGLSGVAGVGDLGAGVVPTVGDQGQGLLTNYSTRVSNVASGTLSIGLTGKTSLNGTGAYAILRFLGNSGGFGFDTSQQSGSGGLTHRFSVRNSLSGNYSYSNFTYQLGQPGFTTQTATLMYTHQFTRKLGGSVSAGPQWTGLNLQGHPASLSLYAQASANYAGKFSHASLSFTRSANGGYGVIAGAISNSVVFAAGRTFAQVWNGSATAAYTQSSNLNGATGGTFTAHTVVGSAQVSRALGRSFSTYASYTLERQTTSGPFAAVDFYSGLTQVAGFGLTYSPAAIHLGHQ
jgi:hypothetical protein